MTGHDSEPGVIPGGESAPGIVLVGPEIEENLGLRYLAASLSKAGFDSRIVAFDSSDDLGRTAERILGARPAPTLVAISLAFQWRAKDCLALIVALRELGYQGHITAGGHFGTFVWQELLRDFPELSSMCLYEAEETIVDLARALEAGESVTTVAGLATRDREHGPLPRPRPELTSLPWPDRRGQAATCLGHRIATLVSGRGCYANCAFCCIAAWHRTEPEGPTYRLRPIDDVADEMASLHLERGIEIFIFHDDNFFVPNKGESLARIHALADALEGRGVKRFATVVKARPTDVTREVFGAMVERLGCIRTFLGVETDAVQGLQTLNRRVSRRRNHEAMGILRELGLYVCYNMLVFDPDATIESLQTNLDFIRDNGDYPSNFGRVELYAGTPLLARMQAESRARGDYLRWGYAQGNAEMERVFRIAMRCFYPRNFGSGALANRLQSTRFDVEVCRFFHPQLSSEPWLERARSLSQALAEDSVQAMGDIIAWVQGGRGDAERDAFEAEVSDRLRAAEARIGAAAKALEQEVQQAVGARCHHGRPRGDDEPRRTPDRLRPPAQ